VFLNLKKLISTRCLNPKLSSFVRTAVSSLQNGSADALHARSGIPITKR
jgi:hypothetical protein